MQRFIPLPLFQGQWKVLSDYRNERIRPDWLSRILIFVVPILLVGLMWWKGLSVADVGSIIAGTTILAGTLLAAFGQLSSWRMKLSEQAEKFQLSDQLDHDSLDETVTHLLAAAYTSGLAAIFLVLASNFGVNIDDGESVTGWLLWIGLSFGAHAGLTFLISVPRLYYAYASLNEVRRELSNVY